MDVQLIDGTYELFRYYFAVPSATDANGLEIGAVRGVLTSVLSMIERGATHIGVATDHVVESFRNDQWSTMRRMIGLIEDHIRAWVQVLDSCCHSLG
jgi:5'-3' exonuclease